MLPLPAAAYPDGAPWGAADPASPQSCASCHFDGDVVPGSNAISLFFGLNEITPGEPLDIHLQFKNPENKKVGFQIIAMVGTFNSASEDVEVHGRLARSIVSRDNGSWAEEVGTDIVTNATTWRLQWVVPDNPGQKVNFWIAMNESNDDQSAFGDRIHFKRVQVSISQDLMLLPTLR